MNFTYEDCDYLWFVFWDCMHDAMAENKPYMAAFFAHERKAVIERKWAAVKKTKAWRDQR